MKTQTFTRAPFKVEAVQLTEANFDEVAAWCNGQVKETEEGVKFLKVKVHRPLKVKHSQAFPTDWILKSDSGFKIFTERAFNNSFEMAGAEESEPPAEESKNLFDEHKEPSLCDGCGRSDKPVTATADGRALVCEECKTKIAE